MSRAGLHATWALIVIILSSPVIIPRQYRLHDANATSFSISLVGSVSGWNFSEPSGSNPIIKAQSGEGLTFQLTSTDTFHRFYVDVNKDGTPECTGVDKCSAQFNATSPTTYSFSVGFGAGNYTYYCSIHPNTMHGTSQVLHPGPDFALSASPSGLTIPDGGHQASRISVTSLNDFTGTVILAATPPGGLSASLNPESVTVAANGTSYSTLNVTVSASAASGGYSVVLAGRNGTLFNHYSMVTITVPSSPSPSPSLLNIAILLGGVALAVVIVTIAVYSQRRRTTNK